MGVIWCLFERSSSGKSAFEAASSDRDNLKRVSVVLQEYKAWRREHEKQEDRKSTEECNLMI